VLQVIYENMEKWKILNGEKTKGNIQIKRIRKENLSVGWLIAQVILYKARP
jgi:hypothetical protein